MNKKKQFTNLEIFVSIIFAITLGMGIMSWFYSSYSLMSDIIALIANVILIISGIIRIFLFYKEK